MSQQLGASRMGTQFSVPQDADERLQAMLALYKSPATIRDMKQVFFYVQADSQTTNLEPGIQYYNLSPLRTGRRIVNGLYYAPIGTTRSFNIADKVNELLDIRVPKDKYVVEINLAECVIEADPATWTGIPDRTLRKINDSATSDPTLFANWEWGITFRSNNSLAAPTGSDTKIPNDDSVQTLNSLYAQATKLTSPQTLFCRIKQLDNGQPYNWAVTNSGEGYSIDKSHQLLVRHGDVNYQELELEFGHGDFEGYEQDYVNKVLKRTNPPQSGEYALDQLRIIDFANDPKLDDIKYHRQFKYYDYNQEYFNTITSTESESPYYDEKVPEFYKGDWSPDASVINALDNKGYKIPKGRNIVQPIQRAPHYPTNQNWQPDGSTTPEKIWQQGKPLFYNQQVSKLGFRFLIRIIHMF